MKNLMNGRKKPERLKRNVSNVSYSVNKGTVKVLKIRFLQKLFRLKDFVRSTQLFKPTFPNISKKSQSTDVVCISSDEEDNSKPPAKPQVRFFGNFVMIIVIVQDDDDDDDLICVGDVIEPEEAEEDMENTGSHAKDELNTKTEDGRVLGIIDKS